jgi:hypothetical protein
MIKILKRWSDSNVLLFNDDELKAYGLKIGDIVDVELCKVKFKKLPKNQTMKQINKEVLK